MIVYNELFLSDNFLKILNFSEKLLECAQLLFITQSSFYIKIDFEIMIGLKKKGTFNVHIII
jgi:hypothetical protein